MRPEEALPRLRALGFDEADAATLADHFLDAERRGSLGHGLSRIEWLETLDGIDPSARPSRALSEPGYERWESNGALGYLTLAAIVEAQLADPPQRARLVVADAFPTGALGYWVRKLAEGGLVAALTATSPPRLASPDGGPKLAGTNPLALAVPSSDGRPLVADVSMGKVTHGDVLRGAARAGGSRPVRRRAGAQGVRARGRAAGGRGRARRRRELRGGAARRAAGGRSRSGPARRRRAATR